MYLSVGDIIKSIESVNAAKDEDFNDDLQIFITQLQVSTSISVDRISNTF